MASFENVEKGDLKPLLEFDFSIDNLRSKYELARLKGPATLVLFTSKKLLVQGNATTVEKTLDLLKELKIGKEVKKQKFKKTTGLIIGSDEALKGDTFGGLVVAGVCADDKQRKLLQQLGVEDSKNLKDEDVLFIAEQIKKKFKHSIKNLDPQQYNQQVKLLGLTGLLNKLHHDVAKDLGKKVKIKEVKKRIKHIVDRYPGCKVGDIIETKAESKYIEVAAASIIARAEGLKQLQMLSRKLGIDVPKGSVHVKSALDFLKKQKLPFSKYVKLHFKNVRNL